MASHSELIYALNKDGESVCISDVPSGLECNCVCPACGALLIAKKGAKRMHHFAHYKSKNCEYGYESSLHLAAKEILLHSKKIMIPPVYVTFPSASKPRELISKAMEIEIERVELERRFDDIIPDIVVYAGNKFFFIEIFVTHPIDEEKLKKLERHNISTIEIDLSHIEKSISTEELSDILLKKDSRKKWKYNSVEKHWLKRFIKISDKRELISRGLTIHVDGCPIAVRRWRGKAYANFYDDCIGCQYCISYNNNGYILCSGRTRISTKADFSISEKDRIINSNIQKIRNRNQVFMNGRCPDCGNQLIIQKGNEGNFLSCSHYPYCKFKAVINEETGEIVMQH